MNVKIVPGPRWLSGELEKEVYAFIRSVIIREMRKENEPTDRRTTKTND